MGRPLKTQEKSKTKKMPVPPLDSHQARIVCVILDKLNFLLAKQVLQIATIELAEDLEKTFKDRLVKNGYKFTVVENIPEHKLNRHFFQVLCQLLEVFVSSNGFGVDWDKRRAETLLRSMQSLEEYYHRQESAL